MATAPLTMEIWERYEPAFDGVMAHLGQNGRHHEAEAIDNV